MIPYFQLSLAFLCFQKTNMIVKSKFLDVVLYEKPRYLSKLFIISMKTFEFRFKGLPMVKATQYKKRAPNALRFIH